jgi:hypothetical protein
MKQGSQETALGCELADTVVVGDLIGESVQQVCEIARFVVLICRDNLVLLENGCRIIGFLQTLQQLRLPNTDPVGHLGELDVVLGIDAHCPGQLVTLLLLS